MKKNHLKSLKEPSLESPSLILCWSEDAGKLGPGATDFLIKTLEGERFCLIEPLEFFPLGEVEIKEDIIQFPESEFYSCSSKNLIIFKGVAPRFEWYKFLSLVLDVAEHYKVKECYTIGGMVSLAVNTSPRRMLTVVNKPELKPPLAEYGLNTEMDFRTPPAGRPTLSSFFLWIAQKRNIASTNIWVETPFYLTDSDDVKARKTLIEFMDKQFSLGIDLSGLNKQSEEQEGKIAQLRAAKPEVDGWLGKLERSEPLTREEGEKLVKEMDGLFKRRL